MLDRHAFNPSLERPPHTLIFNHRLRRHEPAASILWVPPDARGDKLPAESGVTWTPRYLKGRRRVTATNDQIIRTLDANGCHGERESGSIANFGACMS
jgi:hypothetical protein